MTKMEKKYTTLEVLQKMAKTKIKKLQPRPYFGEEAYQSRSAKEHQAKLRSIYNDEAKLLAYFCKL